MLNKLQKFSLLFLYSNLFALFIIPIILFFFIGIYDNAGMYALLVIIISLYGLCITLPFNAVVFVINLIVKRSINKNKNN